MLNRHKLSNGYIWLFIHLVKVVNIRCIMQVVDKLIERDKEIQQLTETGLYSIFILCC